MRVVLQRVTSAAVVIAGLEHARISAGVLVLLGIEQGDAQEDGDWLCGKLVRLRIFTDDHGHMNRSLAEVAGSALIISQFTLIADTAKGNRPSFMAAARPEIAEPLYQAFLVRFAAELGRPVASGVFGADMQVSLTNDGPVTIVIDSRRRT